MNLTWGEFKRIVGELGVKDHEFIETIDVYGPESKEDVYVTKTEIKSSVVMVNIMEGS